MSNQINYNLIQKFDPKKNKQKDVYNISYRIHEIEKLKLQHETLCNKIKSIRQLVTQKVEPVKKELSLVYSSLFEKLDKHYDENLKKPTRFSLQAQEIIGTMAIDIDTRFGLINKEYYIKKYIPEELLLELEEEKSEMMKMFFGDKAELFKDIDFSEMNSADPMEFFKKHAEKIHEFKNFFDGEEEKESVLPNINSAYKKLAKKIHPDLEQDKVVRLEKEELLKKLTVAKDNNDYLAIYEVTQYMTEKEWINDNEVEDLFNEKQLKEFSLSLLDKMEGIRSDIFHSKEDHFYRQYYASSDKKINQNIENEIDILKLENKDVIEAMDWIKTKKGFKEYIQLKKDEIETDYFESRFDGDDGFSFSIFKP